jgi:hypothetical protein
VRRVLEFESGHDESASLQDRPAKDCIRREQGALNKPIQGYVRSDMPLRVLVTALHRSTSDPSLGILEISTDDGVLRLVINTDAARDLQIDLNQFKGDA